ncbi:heat shock protein HspQ [Motiliproteus sediminis]|uniref:heat shock protein HspQ n=1 Tax=Motiliproteus sediminis TaxID=1468178 RepID=UPI001AEFD368|nr:heat shock protein HspQ [Motiliproteus sediminis]
MSEAVYAIGQRVRHALFEYRGVIIDVDPVFSLSDDWYQNEAVSRPPRDRPWYRVLVHNAIHETYVAERNLEADLSDEPVNHPDIELHFSGLVDGVYQTRQRGN